MALIGDFLKSIAQLSDRRFAAVLIRSLLLTVALLLALSFGAGWLIGLLPATISLPWIGDISLPITSLQGLAFGAILWLSSFMMFPVAALFVNLSLETIVDAVEAHHYPDTRSERSPTLLESLISGIRFSLVVIGVNIIALIPYFLAGPLAPFVFFAVNGYLLGREYFQLVAELHLPERAANRLRRRYSFRIWFAGTLMAVPLAVPVLNLIVPVLGAATFTHQFHRLKHSAAVKGT